MTDSGSDLIARYDARLVIDARDGLGEGPTWDDRQQRLIWSDNVGRILHEARADAAGNWVETNRWTIDRRIGAAIPRSQGGFVVAAGMSILALDESGTSREFANIKTGDHPFHLNDAKCDPQGRLWTGTIDGELNIPGRKVTPGRGWLFRIDPNGKVTRILDGITVSNGMAWSADGSTYFYIDSYRRSVDAFDFNEEKGTISNRRSIIRFAPGDGAPDGMTIDEEDGLWVALPGIGEVRRFSAQGDHLATVVVPTPTVTSCTFGGPERRHLFITSARVVLPKAVLYEITEGFSVEVLPAGSETSGAGGLFVCQQGIPGPTSVPFQG